ncbi:MAG TPA: diguanylate cyclase [Gemmatimonadaceae bacterium]
MPNAHILIADDDPALLGTLAWVLKEQGYDVTSTTEGSRVVSLMAERTPDLVLLDITFEDSSGTEVLDSIKQDDRWRDVPVVMMSGLSLEEAAVRTLGLGAADYVRKPFRVRELLARIQAQLRMRAILRSANDTLRETREALTRVQEQADQRRHLMDILHDVTDELSTGEIYHLLARRVARALGLNQCSVVLTRQGGPPRVAAYAYETGIRSDFVLSLDKYPELQTALDTGRPVLVENVMVSPLYRHVRDTWARDGTRIATRSVIAIPFAMEPEEAGVFFLRRNVTEPPLTAADAEFAETVIRAAVSAVQRATLIESTIADNQRLEELAQTDPLTKALNRRALGERLAAEMERVRRYSTTLSLLLIDLDHFKQINDTHGHLAGDDVLIEVAALLQRVVRAVDIVARYGGEEFVVVLPETGAPGAEAFAERLRELIEEESFAVFRGAPIRLTTSIGVACFPGFAVDSVEDLLANADQALYRAKADGRNRVRV